MVVFKSSTRETLTCLVSDAPGAWIPGAKGLGIGSLWKSYCTTSWLLMLFFSVLSEQFVFGEVKIPDYSCFIWFTARFDQVLWYRIRNENQILLFLVVDNAQAYLFLFPGYATLLDVVPLHQNEVSARLMPRGVVKRNSLLLFHECQIISNSKIVYSYLHSEIICEDTLFFNCWNSISKNLPSLKN